MREALPDASRVPVPRLAVPFRNVTVPVGTPLAFVTEAVRVIVTPVPVDKLDEESVVVVVSGGGAVPVPLNATLCGEPVALSVMERLADKVPAEAGSNSTETVQLAPAARVEPHVFADAVNDDASAPVMASDVRVTVPVPVFFTVTFCAADGDPTVADANVRLLGETETV